MALERVFFRYEPSQEHVLYDVSIHAAPGQFVAIVGPSGCGKSTLIRLLLGFESPGQGEIFYDRKDLQSLDTHELRKQLGVVMQDSAVFAGTIFENIMCARHVPPEQMMEAIELSGFDEVLAGLPMGLDTILTPEGATLSGGQRQRMLLARALINKPKVLILDEATSALDNLMQNRISNGLARRQITRIVIAHRLSTIRQADRIYVLDKGRIVQKGRFDELAQVSGRFRDLIGRQML